MQLPLLSGIVGSNQAEFKQSYPKNIEPVVIESGLSKGQLRTTSGAVQTDTGPGVDRGGVYWNERCYRVMGTRFGYVTNLGAWVEIGDVGTGGPCAFDYGFDRLAINSGNRLYYFNGAALSQVTDPDLGNVNDVIWIDGYYMTTDGTSVVVTELSDPTSVKPLKYGSAEEDPDMVVGLVKVANEAHILGRHTIQVFRNVGGNGFPFQTIRGATIPYGCVGARAKCTIDGTFAFVGGAKNEGLSVWIAGQGTAQRISTRTIDDDLDAVIDPTQIEIEARGTRGERRLIVHLPEGRSWVFLLEATKQAGELVWYEAETDGTYNIRHAVTAYGRMVVGGPNGEIGFLSDEIEAHFGELPEWRFDCGLVYGSAKGGIVRQVELVGLTGRGNGTASMAVTRDGQTFSIELTQATGPLGARAKRTVWRPNLKFSNYVGLRFRGRGGFPGIAACEADIEALAV